MLSGEQRCSVPVMSSRDCTGLNFMAYRSDTATLQPFFCSASTAASFMAWLKEVFSACASTIRAFFAGRESEKLERFLHRRERRPKTPSFPIPETWATQSTCPLSLPPRQMGS